jgi:PAS domain S-box-containing protein
VVFAWGAMVVLVALLRMALTNAYQRSGMSDDSAAHSWLVRFRFGVFMSGLAWGSASILLFSANNPLHQIFLVFILAGLAAGGFVSFAADFVSAIVFILAVIAPLIVRMFIEEDSLSVAMRIGLISYLGFAIICFRYINRKESETVAMRLDTAEREKLAIINEQRYRLLLNHSPVGIMHYDNDLVITYCNDRLAEMLHNAADRLVGLDINTLKDQSTLPAMKKALAGELSYYEGYYNATFSDVHRWAAVTCAPSLDSEGKIVGGVAIIQDFTERKLMEAALKESEARYRQNYNLLQSMLESASDVVVYALDRDCRYLSFNNKNREIFRRLWGTDIAVGMSIFDAIGDDSFREFCRRGCDKVLAGNSIFVEAREQVVKNGCLTYEYWENRGSPICNDEGEIVGLTVISTNITERKEAERKLKEALEFTEGVINAIPDMLFEMDRNGGFRNIWTRMPEMLAAHQKTLLGKTVNEVLAEESATTLMEALREAEEKELSFGRIIRLDLPQGARWFELSVSRKPGSPSSDATFLMLSRDISERKQVQQHMELLEYALDLSSDAIYLIDEELRFTYVNASACRALGYSRKELIAMGPPDIDPNMDRETILRMMQTTPATDTINFETHHRTRDGRIFPVEVSATHFKRDGAKFSLCLVRDISERKQAEARICELNAKLELRVLERTTQLEVTNRELRESEQRYREIFDNVVEGIYLLEVTEDWRFRYLDFNPALTEATGIPREEMIGKFVDEALSDEVRAAVVARYRRCVADGKTIEEDVILDLPAGRRNYYSTITPIYYRGRIHRLIGITRDVTELKRAERELEESRGQLRGLTAQREAAREEERKRIAREVHDELGQILTGLKMNVSILNHKLGAGQELAADKMQEALRLTDRALEVARNVASALRPSALEMGIVSALEWLAGRFGTNTGIRCEVHIEDDNIQLDEAHAIALFRIVQESLTNVARHAKATRVDIVLCREIGGYVMKVKDNGVGFDASLKKTDSFGLVGIRERALMLGGAVDIDSYPGQGTEIVVCIPLQITAEES